MPIKDITNTDLINLANCESEPIHVPGSIQPHGFLLAVATPSYVATFCSANTHDYTGIAPSQILGSQLSKIAGRKQFENFRSYVENGVFDSAQPFSFFINKKWFNTSVHKSGDVLILEFEPFPDGAQSLPALYAQTKKFVSFMEQSQHLVDLCQDIANETRSITGYDRVMIYRFDKAYNGEVIAESKRDDLISFSNQKYPHTDIPVQARELYVRNPMRMIADINYRPVALLTLDEGNKEDHRSLDLSLSMLRSVSPIHIEYLKNMGVGATLTISLLKDRKLWGLIACHHYSPKILPHYTRLSALLQGHFLASQIAVREVAEEFEIAQNSENALFKLVDLIGTSEKAIDHHFESPLLLQITNASGAVIRRNGGLYKTGLVPMDKDLRNLLTRLTDLYKHTHFQTSALFEAMGSDNPLSPLAAGVIYRSLAGDDCVVWFRQERIHTINWAGNPDEGVKEAREGERLSPRKSFELWMEEVKNTSEPWRKSETTAATSFAQSLQKHIHLHDARVQEEKYRILNEELQATNKELANLNWIGTHDLKEPIRKIQIFASKLLGQRRAELPDHAVDLINRMRIAAEKMQLLIEDILNYSSTGMMERNFEQTSLDRILKEVLGELNSEIEEKKADIYAGTLPVVSVIPFQIRQLFINLLSNAIKFVSEEKTLRIDIRCEVAKKNELPAKLDRKQRYYKISFADNGIGFDLAYAEKIFEAFQRLHPATAYPGTGIGLAICKKIAENHHGAITAYSEPGKGSVFSVYIPQ